MSIYQWTSTLPLIQNILLVLHHLRTSSVSWWSLRYLSWLSSFKFLVFKLFSMRLLYTTFTLRNKTIDCNLLCSYHSELSSQRLASILDLYLENNKEDFPTKSLSQIEIHCLSYRFAHLFLPTFFHRFYQANRCP